MFESEDGLFICIIRGQLVLSALKSLDWLGVPSLVAIFDPTKDFFIFQNIAKIDTNVANTNFCNIFVAKKCCMKFRVFLTCCKLFDEKIMLQKPMLQTFWRLSNVANTKSEKLSKKEKGRD